jgi:hypothetical protein
MKIVKRDKSMKKPIRGGRGFLQRNMLLILKDKTINVSPK